ncbi:hypothetical protein Tco_1317584 [Tanacetum coccineum]
MDTNSSNCDTPDSPPSQDPYETVVAWWRSRPIPIGRPYRTQPDGVLKMLTARKSVGSLPALRLTSRYPSDSSSSDSLSRYSSSGYAISDHPDDSSIATFARPSRKRLHADLSPPPKRIRDSDSVSNLEISSEDGYESYVPREMWLRLPPRRRLGLERDTVEVESRVGPVIEDDAHDLFSRSAEAIPVHRIQVIKSVQIFQGHEIVGVDLEVTTMTKRISALERDNTRLRSMLDVESQRVDRFQRGLSRD